MKNKLFALLAILSVAFTFASNGEVTPEAQEVVDAYIEATGGTDNKNAINSLSFTGNYSMPAQGINAQITLLIKKPFKLSTTLDIPNIGQIRSAYDGEIGWELNPVTGFRLIEGNELEQLSKQATIFPELNIEESYKHVERANDRPDGSIVLKLINSTDFEEVWVFDPSTHLLTEMDMTIDAGEQGSFPVKTIMEDYRQVGNVLLPYKTVTSNPAFSMEISFDEIRVDEEISDNMFKRPSTPQQ